MNCRFPFRRGGGGGPSGNDYEFPFAGDVELLGRSLKILVTVNPWLSEILIYLDRISRNGHAFTIYAFTSNVRKSVLRINEGSL